MFLQSYRYFQRENCRCKFRQSNRCQSIEFDGCRKIVAAIASKTAQISFDANVAVKNPTVNTATINKLDWKILLEGNEILEGTKTTPTIITGNGTTNATINASVDAVKLLNKNTLDDVINLYKSIKGTSNTKSNISVKVKPTINNYTAPAYITINSSI